MLLTACLNGPFRPFVDHNIRHGAIAFLNQVKGLQGQSAIVANFVDPLVSHHAPKF